jgi:hypothetical protein
MATFIFVGVAAVVVGGIAGAIYAFRQPDPNPKGLLSKKE